MTAPSTSRAPLAIAALVLAGAAAWVVLGGRSTAPSPDAPPPREPAPESETVTPPAAQADPRADDDVSYDGAVPEDLAFRASPIPASVIAAWDAERPDEPTEAQQALLDAWAGIQRADAALVSDEDVDRGAAESAWTSALRAVGLDSGIEDTATASHLAWDAFVAGWGELVAAAEAANTDIAALTRAGLSPDLAGRVGDSGVTLPSLGLAELDGRFTVDEDVLRAVFRWRWFAAIAPVTPTHQLVPADELRFVQRWRIVNGVGVDTDRRIHWIREYVATWGSWDGLPAAFARAVIWADVGENDLAASALDEAARLDPRLAPLRDRYASP